MKENFKYHLLVTDNGVSTNAKDVNDLVEYLVATMKEDFNVAGIILNAAYLYGIYNAIEQDKVNKMTDDVLKKMNSQNKNIN